MSIQFRINESGVICCSSINPAGERIAPLYPCDACKQHFATLKTLEDYAPPDPYAPKPRPATPEELKAARLRELDAEHTEIYAHIAATPQPRLTAAQLAPYDPPNPYGIKAAQTKEAR